MVTIQQKHITQFQQTILSWYAVNKRTLPWRNTRDPYAILISEVMLQQTQVYRVVPKYEQWMEKLPTVGELAGANTYTVLSLWSGLGYNRRAIFLQHAAKVIIEKYGGVFPQDISELMKLPGIGVYTSRAIACFSFDQQIAVIDTNIRKVITHEFYQGYLPEEKKIIETAQQLLPLGKAYDWNQALMDYSNMVMKGKKIPVPKQSPFKQSNRYYRGQIIKLLLQSKRITKEKLYVLLKKEQNFSIEKYDSILFTMIKEKLLVYSEDTHVLTIHNAE